MKEGGALEDARRKIRICLVIVVAAAVLVGLIYYFTDVRGKSPMSEGTLVRQTGCQMQVCTSGGNYGIRK